MEASCTISRSLGSSPVPKHLVEGEVVEHLDELGVADRQGRHVTWEQLVVVAFRLLAHRHVRNLLARLLDGRPP
jgi:hypothetical protein